MKVIVTLVLDVDVQRFYETQPMDENTPAAVRDMLDAEFDNDLSQHPMVENGCITSYEVRRALPKQTRRPAHVREGGTPFDAQSAIIVDCSCGAEYVVPSGGDEYGTMELAQRNHASGVTFEPGRYGETYWLQTGEGPYSQVSLEQWCQAERGAGFHPKDGHGAATGGFSSGALRGTTQHPEAVLRLWKEQNGG